MDVWALRGGVIHNGTLSKHPSMQYDRIYFSLPDERGVTVNEYLSVNNGGIIESALQLDLVLFCDRMVMATREWFAAHRTDAIVSANLPDLVRFRPDGIFPHVVGLPVIS